MKEKSSGNRQKPRKNYSVSKSQDKKRSKVKAPRKIAGAYLYNSGLYYLQRYAASVAHFRNVMTMKVKRSCAYHNDPKQDDYLRNLEDVIKGFIEDGLLNDEAYTRGMVTSLRRRGTSTKAIFTKLKAKGIDRTLTQSTLETIDKDLAFSVSDHDVNSLNQDSSHSPDYLAAITHAKRKKLGPYSTTLLPDEESARKAYQRAMGSFARAGFSYDIAKRVLDSDDR